MTESQTSKIDPTRMRIMILIAVVLALLATGSAVYWKRAHPSLDQYNNALQALKTHHVTVDGSGRVDFSKQFPGLTDEDKALVTWLDDGNFRAMFQTDHVNGGAISGLMYTSRPLQPEDTEHRDSAIRFDQRVIKVGSYDWLVLDEKLNDNWYRVSFKIH